MNYVYKKVNDGVGEFWGYDVYFNGKRIGTGKTKKIAKQDGLKHQFWSFTTGKYKNKFVIQ